MTRRRYCPKCPSIVMMRHFFSAQRHVEVDECPRCGGYWLDTGELGMIWDENVTEQERKKAVQQYFSDLAAKREIPVSIAERKRAARTQKIGQLMRFVVEPLP